LHNNDGTTPHRAVAELCDQLRSGAIDRRSFLRTVAWLGVSAASARAFLGLPAAAATETPKQGGLLRFACAVQQLTDPALSTWIEASNLFRNSLEFLTSVDADNVTHPYLAESWTPSDDLKTWDFTLRSGVTWSNGDAFTTEDVGFNIRRWIDPHSKSANRTALGAVQDFEAIDETHFRLHLSRPLCSLPEQLYAFSCPILHRRFEAEGGDWPKNPIGTGPFQLVEYQVSRLARFKRRPDYWGEPAYLDELRYLDLGTEIATHVAALAAGQVDVLYRITIAELDLVNRLPQIQLLEEKSAQALVFRMQRDQHPFDDLRIRKAILLAADNRQMLDVAYRGRGVLGENYHVAPFQPDWGMLPPVPRDVAQAKRLLAEAGYPDGIDITLALGNTQGRWEQDTALILQQNCAEAGIRLDLNVLPAAEYWTIWDKVPFGLTYWAHRPLGVMALNLAYRSDSLWNESHFKDPDFDAALDRALGVLDPHERSAALRAAEQILQDQAIIVQPYFAENFTAVSSRVHGHRASPSHSYRMDRVWID
jgi:peptide/nickel transport system substrate-binding protein